MKKNIFYLKKNKINNIVHLAVSLGAEESIVF